MKILALNTSNYNGEIAIKNNGECRRIKINNPYSENIMSAIQHLLCLCNTNLSDIDAFGVVVGPGSFTGIRIGMAVIKGFLCGLNKKCVSINSFELLSYNISDSNFITVIDSGNPDCYYAIFKDKKMSEIGFKKIEDVIEYAGNTNNKIYYSSTEIAKFGTYKELNAITIKENTLEELCYEKAINKHYETIENLSPVYIKLSQAEIGLEQKMNENLSFRIANYVDAEALSIIDEQCFNKGTERYSKKSFEGELTESSKHYIVALFGNLVIGYIGLQTLGNELNLLKVAVLPQYQKLGVGNKLMELSFEFKKQNNLYNYFLEVKEDNEKAIKLYKKFGFKTESKREKYYDDGKTALVMFVKF